MPGRGFFTWGLVGVTSLIGQVQAHTGCGHHEIGRRNTGGSLVEYTKRQVTDESSAASSTDIDYECTAYSYAPVLAIKANYPTIWDQASIVAGDTAATSLFATINATVNQKFPTDLPKGTPTGDFTGVNYTSADPDCWWTWRQCDTPAASTGLSPDITTVPEPMTWGFGFDDGPNCSHNALYDFLQEQNQKATMFYIGSNVMDWPLQALRALDDGHQICVHTWSHLYMTSLSNEAAFAELYYTRQAIKDILGVTPLCWRPPYGDVDNRIRLIASSLNLTTITWSHDTDDWKVGTGNVTEADVDANYQNIIDGATNGTFATSGPIVLNHELNNYTMSEMIKFYPQIKAAFKYMVPIATALNITNPYVETNVTYPDFASYTSGTTSGGNGSTSTSSSSTSSSSGASSGSTSAGAASGTGASSAAASASSTKAGVASSTASLPHVGGILGLALAFVGGILLI